MSAVHCTDTEQALKLFSLSIQTKNKNKKTFWLNMILIFGPRPPKVRTEASVSIQAPSPLESSEI